MVNGFWCHSGCCVVVTRLLCGGGVVKRVVAVEKEIEMRERVMRINKHSRIHCIFQLGLLLKQDPRRSKKQLMG